MTKTRSLLMMMLAAGPAALGGLALAAQDRYTLQVAGGLAFSEFRGYEDWQLVAVTHNGDKLDAVLGNLAMIEAFRAGIPGNGKPVPDGAMMAKIHWMAKKAEDQPNEPVVPGTLHDTDFMVKDSKRFADSGGWGYAEFEYDPASQTFRPGDTSDMPPQEHNAKCGFACHTIVADKDYVFTHYPER
jgi:Cytochrome P460